MTFTLDATLPALTVSRCEVIGLISTGQTLSDEVERVVQDATYGFDEINELFNDCLLDVAGKVLIPELEDWADVQTSPNANHVRLPANYHRNLRYAHSTTYNREIKRYGGVSRLFRMFSNLDQTGPVVGVAVKGRDLYYQRIPSSAETLRINFYAIPARLQARTDKPACLPWHLAKPLLKAYACKEIFDEIEDGIDGAKVNTRRWETKYEKALSDLIAFVGPEERPPEDIETEIDWDTMAYG